MIDRLFFEKNKKGVLLSLALFFVFLLATCFYVHPFVVNWWEEQKYVSISSSQISVRDIGEGNPTVIIIHGMACNKNDYRDLQYEISKHTRVVSYDRPGIGYSSRNKEPRTLDYIERDFSELIEASDIESPYILVGHSLGGHIIRYIADRHPEEVAGLVFIDHPHEDWFSYIRETWSEDEVKEYFKEWSSDNDGYSGVRQEELLSYEKNCDLVRGVEIEKNMPVLMFTANNAGQFRKKLTERERDLKKYISLQASLLVNVEDAKQIVDLEVGHWLHNQKPEFVAEEVISFIDKVREKEKIN